MLAVTAELVEEVCGQYTGDGIAFRLLKLEPAARRVELGLDLAGVECLDCVMPTQHLERMIASSLRKRTDHDVAVKVHDPRDAASAASRKIVVLDPTAGAARGDPDSGPDAGDLSGKTVLFRVDVLWPAWDWIVDEWTGMLREGGVEVVTWRRSQGSWGDEAQRLQAQYESLIASSHALVSGLGNCGSCSVSTIEDAMSGLSRGKPTLTLVTTHFSTLAHSLAQNSGRPSLRIHELPHPLSQRPEAEVRQIARDHFPAMLQALGATVQAPSRCS